MKPASQSEALASWTGFPCTHQREPYKRKDNLFCHALAIPVISCKPVAEYCCLTLAGKLPVLQVLFGPTPWHRAPRLYLLPFALTRWCVVFLIVPALPVIVNEYTAIRSSSHLTRQPGRSSMAESWYRVGLY